MNKYLLITLLSLTSTLGVYAQNEQRNAVERRALVRYFTRTTALTFGTEKGLANGSLYLEDKWENRGVIKTNTGEKFLLKNINFNVDQQMFESKFAEDSIFQIGMDKIQYIVFNNRKFQQVTLDKSTKVLESVYESKSMGLYKEHVLKVFEGSYNPMVNRPKDYYKKRKVYHLYTNGKWKEVKLNKKTIVKLLVQKGIDKASIKSYIDENDPDFRSDFEVSMLLKHYLG